MLPLLDDSQQILEPAKRHEGLKVRLDLCGQRSALTVACEERLTQRGIIGVALQLGQGYGQVVEPVAVPTVVEVNRADDALAEQNIPMVQVGMDQTKDIRFLSQRAKYSPYLANRCRHHGSRFRRADRRNLMDGAPCNCLIEIVILSSLHGVEIIDTVARERGRSSPIRRVMMQARHEISNLKQVSGRQSPIQEPSLDPAEQHREAWLWHSRMGYDGHQALLFVLHGFGNL